MANPIAVPGTNVPSGAAVSPGGAQGPSAVSANANNKATLGTDSLVLVQGTAAGVAATTHAQTVSGDDPQLTTLASASTKGLLNQTSGLTTDFIDGTNNSQALQPVIWSVRLRSFNAIGNPTFEVDQRNVGNVLTNPAGSTFIQDRWYIGKVGTMTVSTAGAVPPVAGNEIVVPGSNFMITRAVLHIALTGQEVSLGASDSLSVVQSIEGPRLRELFKDVHSFSILCRSNVAPLSFGIALRDTPTVTQSLTKLCTIPTANVWTLITLPNIPVWPAGNWSLLSGVEGYRLNITLAAGTSLTAPANNTWQSGNFVGAVGQSNFAAQAVNSSFDIAFVQHEPGALCTTPQDLPFTQNLDDCLRYYQKSAPYGTLITAVQSAGSIQGYASAFANQYYQVFFKKVMGKVPTVTLYSDVTGTASRVRNNNTSTDLTLGAAGAFFVSDTSFAGYQLSAVPTANHILSANWSADTGW